LNVFGNFIESAMNSAMNKGPGMNQKQRPRGRPNNLGGKKHMPVRSHNQTFDSNGPEIRIRGNAHQVLEKYLALARDAQSQGDRVQAENFFQHAEHYFRLINANNNGNGQRRPDRQTPADDQSQEEGETEDSSNLDASDQSGDQQEQAEGSSDTEQSETVNA
jgi:hypothetical protein